MLRTLEDSWTVTKRNLIKVKRVPDLLVFATLSPIMFVLLFRYVFGGAIGGLPPGIEYASFLLPGIFAQTVIFGSTITGASIADDLQKGLIDRFRSLPMSRSAVLTGRTFADLATNLITILVMALTGLVVGWRITSSPLEAIGGFVLLLGFAYTFSWLMALVGLLVRTPEVVNNASFIVIFPLTFVSNAFVPLETFPGPLKAFAQWNPVSTVVQGARELFGNYPAAAPEPSGWALQNPVLYTSIWAVIILGIFIPLATRAYTKVAQR